MNEGDEGEARRWQGGKGGKGRMANGERKKERGIRRKERGPTDGRMDGRLAGWRGSRRVRDGERGRKEGKRTGRCGREREVVRRGGGAKRQGETQIEREKRGRYRHAERRQTGRERETEEEEEEHEEEEKEEEEKDEVEEGDAKIGGLPLGDYPRPTSKLRRPPRDPPIQPLASLPTPPTTRELRTKINMNV